MDSNWYDRVETLLNALKGRSRPTRTEMDEMMNLHNEALTEFNWNKIDCRNCTALTEKMYKRLQGVKRTEEATGTISFWVKDEPAKEFKEKKVKPPKKEKNFRTHEAKREELHQYEGIQGVPKLCITLPQREDRRELFKKEMDKAGWTFSYIPGVIDREPAMGIAQAIKNCILKAIDEGWDEVLIMEDDFMWTSDNSPKVFEEIYDNMICSILLGGISWCQRTPIDFGLPGVRKIDGEFSGGHCMLIKKAAFDHILAHTTGNMDRYIGSGDVLTIHTLWPMVAIQRDGHSDNSGRYIHLGHYFSKFPQVK